MKRSSSRFTAFGFERALALFAIVALTLTLLSTSRLTQPAQAQHAQQMSAAPMRDGTKSSPSVVYPETKKVATVDDYFGTKVADPYRWLEADANVPEVASWVESQNKVTFGYLEKSPFAQSQER